MIAATAFAHPGLTIPASERLAERSSEVCTRGFVLVHQLQRTLTKAQSPAEVSSSPAPTGFDRLCQAPLALGLYVGTWTPVLRLIKDD